MVWSRGATEAGAEERWMRCSPLRSSLSWAVAPSEWNGITCDGGEEKQIYCAQESDGDFSFELGALIVNKSLGTLKRTVIKYDTCCVSARSQDDSVSPADIDREFCHARLDARPPHPPAYGGIIFLNSLSAACSID